MTARLPLERLTARVLETMCRQAGQFGLQADHVEAHYIVNPGGFDHANFTITDGARAVHLKLADDEDDQASLAHWQELNDVLVERYHAPRVLAWVKIPRTGFAGLALEHITAQSADLVRQPQVLREVLAILADLHADARLAERLSAEEGAPQACWEAFLDTLVDRFDADLYGIIGNMPPFVSLGLYDWMMSETRHLEGLARDLPEFQQTASSPTHGDLWTNNILVTTAKDWYIIDWDDLALGDPAVDYSILLGEMWRSGVLTHQQALTLLPTDEAMRARFALYQRALLLDQVIDPLADWVEAEFAPQHRKEVREQKERQHANALALYQQWFG